MTWLGQFSLIMANRVCVGSYLVVREEKRVGNDNVLASGDVEYNNLGNIIGCKRLATTVEEHRMVSRLLLETWEVRTYA